MKPQRESDSLLYPDSDPPLLSGSFPLPPPSCHSLFSVLAWELVPGISESFGLSASSKEEFKEAWGLWLWWKGRRWLVEYLFSLCSAFLPSPRLPRCCCHPSRCGRECCFFPCLLVVITGRRKCQLGLSVGIHPFHFPPECLSSAASYFLSLPTCPLPPFPFPSPSCSRPPSFSSPFQPTPTSCLSAVLPGPQEHLAGGTRRRQQRLPGKVPPGRGCHRYVIDLLSYGRRNNETNNVFIFYSVFY